jgi:DNA-binding phage protein
MKLEEINTKTNEAFRYLVTALESGQSEVLTEYLNAMERFHTYSSLCRPQHRNDYVMRRTM